MKGCHSGTRAFIVGLAALLAVAGRAPSASAQEEIFVANPDGTLIAGHRLQMLNGNVIRSPYQFSNSAPFTTGPWSR